jgi:hypothetical protein
MPQRNSSRRLVLRLILFTLAGWLLWAVGRASARAGEPETAAAAVPDGSEPRRARANSGGFSKRRLATTLAFTTLFFAGAAFSAGAGDLVVGALEGDGSCQVEATEAEAAPEESCEPAESTEATGTEEAPSEEASEPAPEPAPSEEDQAGETGDEESGEPAGEQPAEEEPAQEGGEPTDDGSGSGGADEPGQGGTNPDPADDNDEWSDEPLEDDEPDAGPGSPAHAGDADGSDGHDVGLTDADNASEGLDFDDAGYGVVWLNRTLPDPTPPAKRLAPAFARALARTSAAKHVDWALVLGVLRASGHKSSWPASQRSLTQLASRLFALKANTDEWRAALALGGRTAFADRAIALTRYNRAVGLRALVRGLVSQKERFESRILNDPRLSIYAGGRGDIAAHRINVRVLVLLLYLAEAHGQATVSSLDSGHRLYSRPGVISAHKYGLAVDIAGLGGTSILGHQDPGGLTERAVRNILLLPVELKPRQVISLLGLGGPSFPMADHYDHIHVGY